MIRKKLLPVLPLIFLALAAAWAGIEWESGDEETGQTKITIAQVRAVPQKGKLDANHQVLMQILGEVEKLPSWTSRSRPKVSWRATSPPRRK